MVLPEFNINKWRLSERPIGSRQTDSQVAEESLSRKPSMFLRHHQVNYMILTVQVVNPTSITTVDAANR